MLDISVSASAESAADSASICLLISATTVSGDAGFAFGSTVTSGVPLSVAGIDCAALSCVIEGADGAAAGLAVNCEYATMNNTAAARTPAVIAMTFFCSIRNII